jgi:hypothetical protein
LLSQIFTLISFVLPDELPDELSAEVSALPPELLPPHPVKTEAAITATNKKEMNFLFIPIIPP